MERYHLPSISQPPLSYVLPFFCLNRSIYLNIYANIRNMFSPFFVQNLKKKKHIHGGNLL